MSHPKTQSTPKLESILKTESNCKTGRPSYTPCEEDRAAVIALVAIGVCESNIARHLKIARATLRRHFRDELEFGMEKANAAVAQSLFKKATGEGQGALTAAIFWLKARAGWTGTNALDQSGKDVRTIEFVERDSFDRNV